MPLQSRSEGVPLYRYAADGYYTHYDLQAIEEAGGSPVLVQDERPNALVWAHSQRVHGKVLFGEFVRKWYDLKQRRTMFSKP